MEIWLYLKIKHRPLTDRVEEFLRLKWTCWADNSKGAQTLELFILYCRSIFPAGPLENTFSNIFRTDKEMRKADTERNCLVSFVLFKLFLLLIHYASLHTFFAFIGQGQWRGRQETEERERGITCNKAHQLEPSRWQLQPYGHVAWAVTFQLPRRFF